MKYEWHIRIMMCIGDLQNYKEGMPDNILSYNNVQNQVEDEVPLLLPNPRHFLSFFLIYHHFSNGKWTGPSHTLWGKSNLIKE